jgi:hypothetical protein
MEPERIIALILFGLLHWVLAIMLLNDLAARKKVRGGHKAPWALAIMFLVFIGSVFYLIFHPGIFYGSDEE